MLAAIKLNNELGLETDKINDVPASRLLAAEFELFYPCIAQF